MLVRLVTLGSFGAFRGSDELVELYRRKLPTALLVYLSVEREAARDRLGELLWPGRDGQRTRHSVNQALYELRRMLGTDCIDSQGDLIRATDSLQSDAYSLLSSGPENEQAAIESYGGTFLHGTYLSDARGWQDWVDATGHRLRKRFASHCRGMIRDRLRTGSAQQALAVATRWAGIAPDDDEAQHRTIELLSFVGRQSDALRQAELYERVLGADDLEPLDETKGLLEELRTGQRVTAVPIDFLDLTGEALSDSTSPAPRGPTDLAEEAPRREVAPASEAARRSIEPRRRAFYRSPTIAGAVGLSLGIVLSVGAWRLATTLMGPAIESQATVAIAPFENDTGRADLDSFGRMVMYLLTEQLQGAGIAGVAPPDLVLQMAQVLSQGIGAESGGSLSQSLAQGIGAETVVSGAYFVEGDSLVIATTILDMTTGRVEGSLDPLRTPIERPTDALPALLDRVLGHFEMRTDSLLLPVERTLNAPTYAAYVQFDRGHDAYLLGEWQQAKDLLLSSYEADSTFVIPLLFASISASNLRDHAQADSILRLADDRLELQTRYWRLWFAYRRHFLEGDRLAALRAIREAAELAPGSKATYNLAVEAYENGRYVEASEAIRALDPDRVPMKGWSGYWQGLALIHHVLEDYEAELEAGRRAEAEYPTQIFPLTMQVRAMAALGLVDSVDAALTRARGRQVDARDILGLEYEAGLELSAHSRPEAAERVWLQAVAPTSESDASSPDEIMENARLNMSLEFYPEARAAARQALSLQPGRIDATGMLGRSAARTGAHSEADSLLSALEALRVPFQFGAVPTEQARILAELGRSSEALEYLSRAFVEGRDRGLWLHRDPSFESLRNKPDFQAVVRLPPDPR